jgi:hypothetical protein
MPNSVTSALAHSDPNDPTLADANTLLAQNPMLSINDIKQYNINKTSYFKGTIAVCAIYSAFCLLMLLTVMFSEKGSQFMSESFRMFTITFVIGLILVVTLLVIQVVMFKPKVLTTSPYDPAMCPDNWQLQKVTDFSTIISDPKNPNSPDKFLMQYKCVPSPNIINNITPQYIASNINIAGFNSNLALQSSVATDLTSGNYPYATALLNTYNPQIKSRNQTLSTSTPYGNTSNLAFDCTSVYPLYLANKNQSDTNLNGNLNGLACEFTYQCGVPWTSMCPQSTSYNPYQPASSS